MILKFYFNGLPNTVTSPVKKSPIQTGPGINFFIESCLADIALEEPK